MSSHKGYDARLRFPRPPVHPDTHTDPICAGHNTDGNYMPLCRSSGLP